MSRGRARTPAFLGALLLAACAPDVPERTSALLITLDTTIPEALSCYGAPAGSTPALDRLASEGILFENARTVAPLTLPAHASMLTGLYPLRHSVRRNGGTVLPEAADTLAERARAAGYETVAIVAAVVLDGEFGLRQGFDRYDDPPTPEAVQAQLEASRDAAEVAEKALRFLSERDRARPFLLWLHFFDPHFPYAPPPAFLERAGGDPYRGEVAYVDAEVGLVLDRLREEGLLEHTLVLVAGDHGEGLGRHGEDTHAGCVFDSTLRVPLILRLPGAERAGERSSAVTSVVDVFPTVLGALGLAGTSELAAVDGIDLRAPAREREGVYFESYFGIESFHWSQLAGFTDGRFKYVHSSRPELYDVAADPEETDDVLARAPGEAARLARAIEELARRPALTPALLADDYRGLSGEVERLGYAGAGEAPDREPHPLAHLDAPSPHERIAGFAAYKEAQGRLARGDSAEALALLERVVAENPENSKARFSLGLALKALGRFEDAVEAFRPVVAAPGGERIPAELNLAVCLQNLGDAEGALAHYEHALSDTIGPPGALELLIDLLEQLGRTEDAERERRRLAAARASGDTRGPR